MGPSNRTSIRTSIWTSNRDLVHDAKPEAQEVRGVVSAARQLVAVDFATEANREGNAASDGDTLELREVGLQLEPATDCDTAAADSENVRGPPVGPGEILIPLVGRRVSRAGDVHQEE